MYNEYQRRKQKGLEEKFEVIMVEKFLKLMIDIKIIELGS